jgi:hypothetical protein
MKKFIQHPSTQGNWTDATGNKFFLIEIKEGTTVASNHSQVEGEDEAAVVLSLGLTKVEGANPFEVERSSKPEKPTTAEPKKWAPKERANPAQAEPQRFVPKEQVPVRISPVQLRLGLIAKGITIESVGTFIASIADAIQRDSAKTEWEYALWFERKHPLIATIATHFSMSDADVDKLFIDAIKL